jgi:hypothetical protein
MRNFIICILHHRYGHQIKENEIGRVYSTHERCQEYPSVKMLVVNPHGRDHLGDQTWMRSNTETDRSEMRVDDVEWIKLAYDGRTVSAVTHTIMNLGFH